MSFKDLHNECRAKAKSNFIKAIPNALQLMDEMENYLGKLYTRLSKIHFTGEQNQHRLPIIISFIRTHMVIDELIKYCENIEAAVLIRKQLELLARYKETENMEDLKQSIRKKKVPNMKKIENGGIMYSMLSEIAHTSKPETYTLLGYQKSEDETVEINLFGIYEDNIKVTLGIHIDIFCRFFGEMLNFQQEQTGKDFTDEDMEWMSKVFIPLGFKSKIKYFDQYK